MSRAGVLRFLKAGISIGLVALILWRVDLRAVLAAAKGLDLWLFSAAMGSAVVAVSLRAYRWHLLLKVQGGRGTFATALRVTYMSSFLNNLFLGTLGGDVYRAYHASDYSRSAGGAASSVVMERATGLLSALLLILVSGAFLALDFVTTEMLLAICLVGLLGTLGLGVLVTLGARAGRLPVPRRLRRLTDLVEEMSNSLIAYRHHRGLLLGAMLLSLAFHMMHALNLFLFALAAGATVPFLSMLFIGPLTGVLVVLPISINGIGVREGAMVLFLERIGIPGPEALVIALSGRVANMTISLIGGLLFLGQRSARDKAEFTAR